MRAVGAETVAGKLRVRVLVAIDDAAPSRKRPCRCAEMDCIRQALREGFELGLQGRGQHAARLWRLSRLRRLRRSSVCRHAEKIELIVRLPRFDMHWFAVQSAFS